MRQMSTANTGTECCRNRSGDNSTSSPSPTSQLAPRFEVDIADDIAFAKTPPKSMYTCESLFARQLQTVFAPSWQVVPEMMHLGETKGARHPVTLFDELDELREPLVLTRDAEGSVLWIYFNLGGAYTDGDRMNGC